MGGEGTIIRKAVGEVATAVGEKGAEREGAALSLKSKAKPVVPRGGGEPAAPVSNEDQVVPGARSFLARKPKGEPQPVTLQEPDPAASGPNKVKPDRPDVIADEGAPGGTVARALTAAEHAAGVGNRGPMTYVVTDTEGMRGRVDALVRDGRLKWTPDGKLDFASPHDKLVFGGDATDRGPDSIKLVNWLSDLKQRYPDRVTLIHGNRDLNKLGILRDMPGLEGAPTGGYADWLKANNQGSNTLANRLDYWLDGHSARGALEQHRLELEATHGQPVTRDRAATDYMRWVSPGGEYFDYLKQGQLIHTDGRVVFNHAGLTDSNVGIVPGETERVKDARLWQTKLNAWEKDQLDTIERQWRDRGPGEHIPDTLMRYGDAVWDPTAGPKGRVFANDQSVVYGSRAREDGNFRAPEQGVRDYLQSAGIDTEILGHSPAGDVPTPLHVTPDTELARPGFLRMMGDTSFGGDGAWTTMGIDKNGGVRIAGATRDGTPVGYRITAESKPPVGLVTGDGFTVIGRNRTGGSTQYVLGRYYNGYMVEQKQVTREELLATKPRPPEMATGMSQDAIAHRDLLITSLKNKGVQFHDIGDDFTPLLKGRTPIVFSGSANYGRLPVNEEELRTMVRSTVDRLDPNKTVLFTGGTDNGVEKIVHEEAQRRGIQVIGFIQEGAVPGEISRVRDIVLAGPYEKWLAPLSASMRVAQAHGGSAVWIGGGGVVADGIRAADDIGIHSYLMRRGATAQDTGGASSLAVDQLPRDQWKARTFGDADELIGLLQR